MRNKLNIYTFSSCSSCSVLLTLCTVLEIVVNAHETVLDELEIVRDLIDEGGKTRDAVRDHRLRTTKNVLHQLLLHLKDKTNDMMKCVFIIEQDGLKFGGKGLGYGPMKCSFQPF